MTPADELAPETTSPAPDAAPAPEAARPEAPAEDRAQFDRGLFDKMVEQTRTAPIEELKESEAPEKPAPREPREPREPRPGRPEAPAAPTGRYAGRYETPEALEAGYRELERARQHAEGEKGRAQETAQRLERLLVASLSGQKPELDAPARPAPPSAPAPANLAAAVQTMREEHERLGLADPEADPLRFVRALAVVLAHDAEASQAYVGPALRELQRETAQRQGLEKLKTDFFTQHPDLRTVRLDRLRRVAEETEETLRQSRPELVGDDFIKEWFDLTAREARATFRTDSGAQAAPAPSGRAAGARARTETSRATGAPFAESPSPRASEPALTGQAFHLARVFGRGA